MSPESLTSKQENFCRLIASGKSRFDSYREAYDIGEFTKRSSIDEMAYALVANNIKITSRIEELKQGITDKLLDKVVLTREYVLEQLHQNALKASQAIPVTDRSGHETGEYSYYPNAVNRSYELIGKELDMFRDKTETQLQSMSLSLELKAASLGELEAMLALVREQQQQTALNEAGNTIPLVDSVNLDAESAEGL